MSSTRGHSRRIGRRERWRGKRILRDGRRDPWKRKQMLRDGRRERWKRKRPRVGRREHWKWFSGDGRREVSGLLTPPSTPAYHYGAFSRKSPRASEWRLTFNTCDVTGELAKQG